MFKDVLRAAHLDWFAQFGLLMFFLVFVGITFWTLTRSRRQIDRWSGLPLESDEAQYRSAANLSRSESHNAPDPLTTPALPGDQHE